MLIVAEFSGCVGGKTAATWHLSITS